MFNFQPLINNFIITESRFLYCKEYQHLHHEKKSILCIFYLDYIIYYYFKYYPYPLSI